MSVVMRQAYQGDPGLFGFLGKVGKAITGVASKVLPGPFGAVAGLAHRAIPGGGGSPATRTIPGAGRTAAPSFATPRGLTDTPRLGLPWQAQEVPAPGIRGRIARALPGGKTGMTLMTPEMTGGIAPKGMKLNKTGYYRTNPNNPSEVMYVPPQSVWVKIRRRNPGNSRANDRAISRISSAKKMAKHLSRISIREKC